MLVSMSYYVYIMASQKNGTLYIDVTNNLARRVFEHKNDQGANFTKKYKVHHLVYYEVHDLIDETITREKQLKRWKRQWKIDLIETLNVDWEGLSGNIHMMD